ncbi:cytochrome P450- family 76- subfamily C-polypeptide 7 [Striga hermonthica]|uniref:Cytochrome P450- family 76- subfamily C-polypeptide 7 n=1 Tax=Striga hermonthica TaxID=68872 RepID=A0A9N7RMP0_STRHE|nr:cytochrome P450- family 76- subfamily C-polypeptide 7 [Striga hermonthica]
MELALLILVPIIFLFLKHFLFKAHRLPPGPNPFYVLTFLSELIYKPHRALRKLSQMYGPLMSFRLGDQLLVVASSPETAREFCRTHDRMLSGRHLPTVYINLPGTMHSSIALAPECSKSWKLLRSIGQNCVFSSKAMEMSVWIRKAKVNDLVKHLKSREGQVADLEDLIFVTLSNIISASLTSKDLFNIEGQGKDDYKVMLRWVNEVIEKTMTLGVVDFLPILKSVDFWSKRKAMDMYREIKRTWGGIIDERKSMRGENVVQVTEDFLDIALSDSTFSEDQIGNALMELLIAATDSTTITTVWLIVELMRNQDMLSKVRHELENIVNGGELNEVLLSECHYFQACIKETLRLHVPAPMLVPHRALETCKVNEYIIPKDSMVLVNAWAIARDPNYWEDATNFNPERFLDSKVGYMGTHFEYLPFGTGLRMCPGSNVAFKNIQMLAGTLLHYFEWSLPNGGDATTIDMGEKYLTTLKKAKPLLLIPKLRN